MSDIDSPVFRVIVNTLKTPHNITLFKLEWEKLLLRIFWGNALSLRAEQVIYNSTPGNKSRITWKQFVSCVDITDGISINDHHDCIEAIYSRDHAKITEISDSNKTIDVYLCTLYAISIDDNRAARILITSHRFHHLDKDKKITIIDYAIIKNNEELIIILNEKHIGDSTTGVLAHKYMPTMYGMTFNWEDKEKRIKY